MTINGTKTEIGSCAGKVPLTRAQADEIVKRPRSLDKNRHPYRCQHCGHWHLGRSPPGWARTRRRQYDLIEDEE
jgi:DNA-directed RNA polymerase subunit RPC12/RpoP